MLKSANNIKIRPVDEPGYPAGWPALLGWLCSCLTFLGNFN